MTLPLDICMFKCNHPLMLYIRASICTPSIICTFPHWFYRWWWRTSINGLLYVSIRVRFKNMDSEWMLNAERPSSALLSMELHTTFLCALCRMSISHEYVRCLTYVCVCVYKDGAPSRPIRVAKCSYMILRLCFCVFVYVVICVREIMFTSYCALV